MRTLSLIGLLAAFLLSGCIYESPLDAKPKDPVDERFVGTWKKADDPDNQLIIRAFDKDQYVVVTADGTNLGTYRAYTCDVEGFKFANVQELAPGEDGNLKWAFFTYRLNASGNLVVRMLNNKVIVPQLATAKELRAAIKKNRDNPALFLQELVYVQAKN